MMHLAPGRNGIREAGAQIRGFTVLQKMLQTPFLAQLRIVLIRVSAALFLCSFAGALEIMASWGRVRSGQPARLKAWYKFCLQAFFPAFPACSAEKQGPKAFCRQAPGDAAAGRRLRDIRPEKPACGGDRRAGSVIPPFASEASGNMI